MTQGDSDTTNGITIRQGLIVFAIACVVLITVQYFVCPHQPEMRLTDLPGFYTASYLVLNGHGSTLFDPQQQQQVSHVLFPYLTQEQRTVWYFNPPFATVLILPLAAIPVAASAWCWFTFLNVCAAASLAVLHVGYRLTTKQSIVLTLLLATNGLYWSCIRDGQPAVLMLLGLSIFLAVRNRNSVFGLILFILKPQLLLPILAFLLGRRQYALVNRLAIGLLLVVLFSFLTPGIASYTSFYDLMKTALFGNPFILQPDLNPTLRGQLLREFSFAAAEWIFNLSAAIMVIALVFCFAVGRQIKAHDRNWLNLGLLVILPVGLVTAFHVHNYDLIILAPLFAFLLAQWKTVPGLVQGAVYLFLAASCLPVYQLIYGTYYVQGGTINVYFIMLLLLSALFVVYVYNSVQKAVPTISVSEVK